jgi:hypothetical protein
MELTRAVIAGELRVNVTRTFSMRRGRSTQRDREPCDERQARAGATCANP